MRSWLFRTPARAVTAIVTLTVTCVLVAVTVTVLRVQGTERTLRHAVQHARTPLVGTPVTTPALTLGTPEPTVPDLGDPRPTVLAVVTAWINGVPDTGHVAPAALDDLVQHAAPAGLDVTGTARVTRPGPSAALVTVPTNRGVLDVDVAVLNGEWAVTGVGWGA